MAVTIDIDVKASEATGKIGAIAASLKGLDRVANDIDLDFDADIGEITEEIDNFSDALADMEVDMNNLTSDLEKAAAELDGTEVHMVTDGPDGSTGDGDSSGNDPPIQIESGFEKAARSAQTDGGETGMSRIKQRRLFSGLFGDNIEGFMSDSDINYQNQGFASWAKDRDIHMSDADRPQTMAERQYGDFGYGIEPMSMAKKRQAAFTQEDYRKANGFHKPNISPKSSKDYIDRLKSTDFGQRVNSVESLGDAFRGLGRAKGRVSKKLSALKPSMSKMYSIIAAMIPIAIGLGTQLLGVAAAMGAVAVAGAAIAGLGLLGHGESMEESMAGAKQQLRDLKNEMFDMAQPAMQQFAPIQARMFDAIPEALGGVFEEMEGLTQFEDTLFSLGGSLADGLERAIQIINDNEAAISDLSKTFGKMIGGGLLDFFEFLIQSASENKQLIIDLGGALMTFAEIAYDVSMAVSRIVAALGPLLDAVAWVSGLLNNRLVVGLLTAITVGYVLTSVFLSIASVIYGAGAAVMQLIGLLQFLGSGSIIKGILMGFQLISSYISTMIGQMTALQMAIYGVAAALVATGIGAIVVGAGMAASGAMQAMGPSSTGSGGSGGTGGTQVYNDNRQYTIEGGSSDDYASQKATEDAVTKVNETNSATNLPPVQTNSETSDGGR